jgi:hypothetical protein
MIRTSLNSLDKLDELETRERKEHKGKTRREAQLFVSIDEISAPTNNPLVYFVVDLSNPFDNPSFIVSLANYNPLDFF